MYQDPFDDMCQRIMTILMCFVMMLALSVYYVYTSAKYASIFAYLRLKGLYIDGYYFVYQAWSHLFLLHIEPWLIVFGFKRSKTWAEREQRRLEVSSLCGYEISRTPDMEEGLRQEGCL